MAFATGSGQDQHRLLQAAMGDLWGLCRGGDRLAFGGGDHGAELGQFLDGEDGVDRRLAAAAVVGRQRHAQEAQYTLVSPDAGAVPYYSRQKAIDPYGLNDVYLAHLGRLDPDYIFQHSPEILVLTSYRPDRIEHPFVSGPLSQHPAFSRYELVGKFRSMEDYYEFVYLLKDRPDLQRLAAELRAESDIPITGR